MTIFDKMTEMGYSLYNEEKYNNMFQKETLGNVVIHLMFDYDNRSVLGCVYPTKLIYNSDYIPYINKALLILEQDLRTLEGYGITIERR